MIVALGFSICLSLQSTTRKYIPQQTRPNFNCLYFWQLCGFQFTTKSEVMGDHSDLKSLFIPG